MPILNPEQIFALANRLPRISTTAVKIVSYIDNPDTSREQIVNLVKTDERIFAECLKQANSAAIASVREYRTINEIVDVLGFNHVKKVALFLSAKSMIRDPNIWFESVFVAIASQYLALRAGYDRAAADRVYMAGLFQNFGAFLLKQSYPAIYSRILEIDDFQDRIKSEKQEFGISYPEISSLLLVKYGLPAYVTDIMSKQPEVYSGASSQENAFIEIARLFSRIPNLNIAKIYADLDTDAIKSVIEVSGIELFSITQDSVDRIERQTKEFVRA